LEEIEMSKEAYEESIRDFQRNFRPLFDEMDRWRAESLLWAGSCPRVGTKNEFAGLRPDRKICGPQIKLGISRAVASL